MNNQIQQHFERHKKQIARFLIWTCVVAAVVATVMVCSATAEDILVHDGAAMTLTRLPPNGIQIRYVDVPAALRELGVVEGTVLLQGQWDDDYMLEGEAFVFAPGCAPIAYPIRGVVTVARSLLVVGPTPRSCEDRTLTWSAAAVMKFDPPRATAQPRQVESKKPKARKADPSPPRPKPRPARPAAPQQPYQNPYQQYPYWRW